MTTLGEPGPARAAQTPAQWAVRWFAIVAAALLFASVPLLHFVWHVVLGHEAALLRTRSQVPAPPPTAANLLDGSWMGARERELREDSPVTWWLRGNWNELLYRCGMPQSRQVHFGADDWLFIRQSIWPDNAGFERATAARQRFIAEVRDLVRAAGAELFMMVIPDKARVYPDIAFPDGIVPPRKAGNYARILAEIEALGIPTVDLLAPMAAHRRSPVPGIPPGDLYFAGDTHWRPPGALLAGYTVAAALEARFGDRLSPRRALQITGPETARLLGDLTMQLGLLAVIVPDPVIEQRPVALSLLTDRLAEPREYYGISMSTERGPVGLYGDDPDAEVLVIGTSFAEENGLDALMLALGRPVRGIIVRGPEGLLPLRAALPELRRGTQARIVVWEMVERGLFEGAWLDPKL